MQTNNQCQEHRTFYFYNMKLCAISNLGWNFDNLSREPIIYLFWQKITKTGSPWHHVYSTTIAFAVAQL